ncbi:hypothetical protein W97_00970 [Coniosporium apollinis CBS 100218]|uniref:Nuclear protein DGCR14 n=1 Tax=Coniosporium apollinis (strain CBS 100218) TaxID=1168221 RepID=R7YIY2_CONA1|nr:uncharacterized protein W97_00970 [Coniosporium apollinis CBS 100218]EON61754.1 hypothetical protein W97_00970 [Coniosporium apollinis CBS 100218]
MASQTPSQALTKRSSSTALMPPPPPPKRIKRPATVLDEDTYTDALSHIIARDFFPGLLETEAQSDYLNALDSGNNAWIAEAGRTLTQVMTPGPDGRRRRGMLGTSMTPTMQSRGGEATPRSWGGETPASVAESEISSATTKPRKPDVDTTLSLTAFQSKYTSEDNESFNALLDIQNAKRVEKYTWLWSGNKIPSGRQIAYRARSAQLLESSERAAASQALIPRPSQDPDTRPAMADTAPSAPRNAFMFAPDSIEDDHTTVAAAAEATSTAPPRAVNHSATRLPLPPSSDPDSLVPPSPSLSAIDAAIAGRPRPTASEPGYAGSETPVVGGYRFVDAEPTPSELAAEDAADRGLLARLGVESDAAPNPFTIKEASGRERLHHRMVERTSAAKRSGGGSGSRLAALRGDGGGGGGGVGGKTPTPKFISSPVVARGNLTPAAQRLFERVGTPKRDGMEGAFGGHGRKGEEKVRGYLTPKPRIK